MRAGRVADSTSASARESQRLRRRRVQTAAVALVATVCFFFSWYSEELSTQFYGLPAVALLRPAGSTGRNDPIDPLVDPEEDLDGDAEVRPEDVTDDDGDDGGDITAPVAVPGTGSGAAPLSKSHLFFLKTHKTGSSTLQNIFLRYGYRRQQSFALPRRGHSFNYPGKFKIDLVWRLDKAPFNFFTHHARVDLSLDFLPQVFGAFNPVKATILRQPYTRLKSHFNYFVSDPIVRKAGGKLGKFLEDPEPFMKGQERVYKGRIRNGLAFDLGLPYKSAYDKAEIDAFVAYIRATYDLVMINEHFHESIILLKEMMGWSEEDILYIVVNANKKTKKPKKDEVEMAAVVEKFSAVDSALYAALLETFMAKVDAYGREKMEREVKTLRDRLDYTFNDCFSGYSHDRVFLKRFKIYSSFNVSLPVVRPNRLENLLCRDLARGEIRFTDKVKADQALRYDD